MLRFNTLSILATGIALFAAAPFASAGTVSATLDTVDPGQVLQYSLNGGSYKAAVAGRLNWTRTGGTEPDAPGDLFSSFCIEITQNVYYGGNYTFDVVDLDGDAGAGDLGIGQDKALRLGELWGRYFDSIIDNISGAAFQIAVWEIIYDDTAALDAGSFQARFPATEAPSLAQTWLTSLDGQGPIAPLMALSHPTAQDQVFFKWSIESGSNVVPVAIPLPGAAWGGAALVGLLAVRRYRILHH